MCLSTSLIHIVSVVLLDHNVPTSTRQSIMSERSGGISPYHSSPRPSLSHSYPRLSLHNSHNTLPQEGERLSFTLDDTFRELDEFQEDPPLFLEENSWEGEDSEHCDPTLTLLNSEHFQVSRVTVQCFIYQMAEQRSKVAEAFGFCLLSLLCLWQLTEAIGIFFMKIVSQVNETI